MASLKRKLLILAVVAVVLAVFFPVLKKKYNKHVKPHLDLASGIYIGAKNFSVFGVHVPWRYVLPGVILFLAVQLFRRRRRIKKLEQERLQREQKFMTEESVPKPVLTTNVVPQPAEPAHPPEVLSADPNDLSLMANRVRTFNLWPTTSSANVFELARAGFSFTGPDDVVRCFKCNGTLKEWTPKDSPIESHKEFYPDCPYIVELANNNTIFDSSLRLKDLSTVCDMVALRLNKLCIVEGKRASKSPATKQLSELQKRLDTTERTMHLVMKQMEAVTKCLAKTLADDPALSGDKSLAEITEGLVNLKESNV